MSQKQTLLAASIFGFLAVSIGAFGAHALKELLTINGRLETFELAVKYQFYHTLALLGCGLLMEKFPVLWLRISSILFTSGVILFCGSLYLLSLYNLTSIALVTPFGGLLFLGGWGTFFMAMVKGK
jgi:uncharacterized membrane protein YgdD (TMEM256/DUF423 family)